MLRRRTSQSSPPVAHRRQSGPTSARARGLRGRARGAGAGLGRLGAGPALARGAPAAACSASTSATRLSSDASSSGSGLGSARGRAPRAGLHNRACPLTRARPWRAAALLAPPAQPRQPLRQARSCSRGLPGCGRRLRLRPPWCRPRPRQGLDSRCAIGRRRRGCATRVCVLAAVLAAPSFACVVLAAARRRGFLLHRRQPFVVMPALAALPQALPAPFIPCWKRLRLLGRAAAL